MIWVILIQALFSATLFFAYLGLSAQVQEQAAKQAETDASLKRLCTWIALVGAGEPEVIAYLKEQVAESRTS